MRRPGVSFEHKLGVDSLNMEIFYCSDLSLNELMLAAQTHPFMSEKRLLVLKDAHKLKSAEIATLSQFLKTPMDTACILLMWPERVKKENKAGALFKTVEARARWWSSGDCMKTSSRHGSRKK